MPKKRNEAMPDISLLHECFEYDTLTGALTWKARPRWHFSSDYFQRRFNENWAGRRAELPIGSGWLIVRFTVNRRRLWVMASWAAWAMTHGAWPADLLDHANRNQQDNRIGNLRPATSRQNNCNTSARRNSTGFRGVSRDGNRFRAAAQLGDVRLHLGSFDTPVQAHSAYLVAVADLHGQFAHCRAMVRTASRTMADTAVAGASVAAGGAPGLCATALCTENHL